MTPTEHEGTVAVDAAARVLWDQTNRAMGIQPTPPFDDLAPLEANAYRERVLPVVWAALEALPDRRAEGWDAGCRAQHQTTDALADDPDKNPYREAP